MMGRQDFEVVAGAINTSISLLIKKDMLDVHTMDIVIATLCFELNLHNPRFDRAKFIERCWE